MFGCSLNIRVIVNFKLSLLLVRCWLKGINIAFFSENDVESEWTYVVPFLVGEQYKIVLLTYKVLHGMALWCLGPCVRAADLPGRRALRSASTSRLVVPTFKHHHHHQSKYLEWPK